MGWKLTRSDVIRKCIIVFDALKRACSKGNAGLEPMAGSEASFWMDDEVSAQLREILREMETGEKKREAEEHERRVKDWNQRGLADWQKDIMEHGTPERLVL